MRLITHSVVVQLLIGALISAFVPFASQIERGLSFTTFSVIGLFMSVGLSLHPEKFKKDLGITSLIVGVTTVVPMVLFYFMGRLFNISDLGSWTIAVVLVTTGTGVTVQTLMNLGIMRSTTGEFITLISALDDIPAAIAMAFLLSKVTIQGEIQSSVNWLMILISAGTFILLMLLKKKSFKLSYFLKAILLLLFGVCSAKVLEAFHVSLVMGGLMAGAIVSIGIGPVFEKSQDVLEKMLKPVLLLYMIYIGMKLSPEVFKAPWAILFSVLFIIVAISSKWFTTYFLLRKRAELNPVVVAWGMVPRGIPGFAFATAAVTAGLITKEIFSLLILIVSVTTWIGLLGVEFSARKSGLISR